MRTKKTKIKDFKTLVVQSSSPFAKEMAITKKGKGGVFEDKRFKKKNSEKWKQDVKKYY